MTRPAAAPDTDMPEPPEGVRPTRARSARMFGGRNAVISAASTAVFFLVVAVVLATAPGIDVVVERFFAWEHLRRSLPAVVDGFLRNIQLMLIAELFVLVLGLLLALVRGLPGPVMFPLRMVAIGYIDLFRGVPLILVLFVVGFGLPGLQLQVISQQSIFAYGVISLVLVYSAYVAEVYRAGIESVHPSQMAAARSLSLSRWQSMRFVVLPQAVRRVVPPLLNDFIGLQKDTALVSVIGVVEATREAQSYGATYFNYAGYVCAAALFVMVTIPLARLTDHLIARDRRRRQGSVTS